MEQKILLTECPDSPGLIAKITQVCFQYRLNIIKNSEFVDVISQRFFMRTVFTVDDSLSFNEENFLQDLDKLLPSDSERRIASLDKKRVVIMATKEAHCLGDLLMKNYYGELDVDIKAVISNYEILQDLVEKFDVPFIHIDHQGLTREQHDEKILEEVQKYSPDYIVLAKYMRILSEGFVSKYPNRILNIHHSFLPAFIGASPYKQAYERGVKIIGATAHFVNSELDQGPIIEQDVTIVDHSYSPELMAKAGQAIEESVLLKALQQVLKEKVFVHGNRTVVFR